jgi:hypothetical protein
MVIIVKTLIESTEVRTGVVKSYYQINSYENRPKWHGFLMIRLAETVNRLEVEHANVQHRTLNIDDAWLYRF